MKYSVSVSQPNAQNTSIHRNPLSVNGFLSSAHTNMQSLLLERFKQHEQKQTLGVFNETIQDYDYCTYKQIYEISTNLGSWLSRQGIEEYSDNQGLRVRSVGIYLKNRREWTLTDLACQLYGFTSVPFYDTLGMQSLEGVQYLFAKTSVTLCICQASTAKVLANAKIEGLKTIVLVEKADQDTLNKLHQFGIKIYDWSEVIKTTKVEPLPNIESNGSLTIVFTSGTTGTPKAAIHSQGGLSSMLYRYDVEGLKLEVGDVYMSYLPLPHIYERVTLLGMFCTGCTIKYSSGDILNLKQDLQRAKPTYFATVPRILNKFYEAITLHLSTLPPDTRQKFNQIIDLKIKNLHKTGSTISGHDQALQPFRQLLGGCVRLICSGAAPISPQILDYLKVVFCCPLVEGYGQTETCAASFVTEQQDNNTGYVGGPTISQEFKLQDVPDMNYLSTDIIEGVNQPRGEICIRGPSVFKGYYRDESITRETIDSEGFVHTGDIGQILPNGALKIIDRKKNLFKLQQGEYVSPEKIENSYVRSTGISEVLVIGDPLQDFCVAIVVPEPSHLLSVAKQAKIEGTPQELCTNYTIRKLFLQQCNSQGSKDKLNGFEQIKNIYLEYRSFVQVGILTETQKMQRHQGRKVYESIVTKLYQEGQLK